MLLLDLLGNRGTHTVETPWISQLIPRTFFFDMSCDIRTALFTKKNHKENCSAKTIGF